MSNGIQLQNVRYTGENGDQPPGYDNPSFQNQPGSKDQSVTPSVGDLNEIVLDDPPVGKPNGGEPTSFSPNENGEKQESSGRLEIIQDKIQTHFTDYGKYYKIAIGLIILALYIAYFIAAMVLTCCDNEGTIRLLWVTALVVFCLILSLIWKYLGPKCNPCCLKISPHSTKIAWIVAGILILFIITFILVDIFYVTKTYYNLVSLCGVAFYVLLLFLFSTNPSKINWRAVVWGLVLQFIFAIMILRWDWGYLAFKWLGDRVSEFLDHTLAGSRFVFGDFLIDSFVFAFRILSVVVFFSSMISVLYYFGVMQFVIKKVAYVMQITMGTTAGESLNAAGNIFIGQSEAPLLIRPLIGKMTKSELHSVMTGGFATIAGSVLAAYIGFGVPANHLITASVMSAPAALAMSKLFYPETEESHTKAEDVAEMEPSPEYNVIEAASNGASNSIMLVANIAANLIAFIAILAFVNSTLRWLGHRVGYVAPEYVEWSFEYFSSYIFYPFAIVMGVEPVHARQVAQLIGIKTFLNEFVGYASLGNMIKNAETFDAHYANATLTNTTATHYWYNDNVILVNDVYGNITLEGGHISKRSLVIATYTLCGFANFGSIGVMLGVLGAMAPNRKPELASLAVRAMIAGNVACFLTACVAGVFYQPDFDPL